MDNTDGELGDADRAKAPISEALLAEHQQYAEAGTFPRRAIAARLRDL